MGFTKRTGNTAGTFVLDTRTDKLERWAREQMDKHGLTDWTFEWDRGVRRFGACHYGKKKITISLILTNKQPNDDQFRETVLHEIAHAITPNCGHNYIWKNACIKVGAKPERCYDESVEQPEHNWHGMCPTGEHGIVSKRYRLTEKGKRSACSRCCREKNGGVWHPDFLLVWKDNK